MNKRDAAAQVKAMMGDATPRFKAIKGKQIKEFEAQNLDDAWPTLQRLAKTGFNVYVFAQDIPTRDLSQAKDIHVETVRALFADGDESEFPETWHITPTFTLFNEDTARWWAFWRMDDCPLDRLSETQRRIAKQYGADPNVSNPSRTVRLAGLPRWKDGKEFASYDYETYSGKTSKFEHHVSSLPMVEQTRKKADNPRKINVRQDQEHNIRAYLKWLDKDARIADEGNRNNTLAATAAMGHSYALTIEKVAEMLWDHYNPRLTPPLEQEEFDICVISGYGAASSKQGNMTVDYRRDTIAKAFKVRTQEVRPSAQSAVVQTDKDGQNEQPDANSRFKTYSYQELTERKPPIWLLHEVIPELGYTILFGLPGTFKTFVALDMALCIATGKEWHGHTVQQGRVLYCMGEGIFDAQLRIKAWLEHNGADEFQLVGQFKVIEPAPMLKYKDDIEAFLGECGRGGNWDLVVIDTIGRTMPGIDDHAGQGAREFSSLTTMIAKSLGAATLALTHTRKDKGDVLLGSGAYEADADVALNMVEVQKHVRADMYQRKIKYGAPAGPMGFERVKVGDSLALNLCDPRVTMEKKTEVQNLIRANRFKDILRGKGEATWIEIRAIMLEGEAPQDEGGRVRKSLMNWHANWGGKVDYYTGHKRDQSPIYKWD